MKQSCKSLWTILFAALPHVGPDATACTGVVVPWTSKVGLTVRGCSGKPRQGEHEEA